MSNPNYIKPPRSEDCTWRRGPPPEIGWWPASVHRTPTVLRFWDGRVWSSGAPMHMPSEAAGTLGEAVSLWSSEVEWTGRWWEN